MKLDDDEAEAETTKKSCPSQASTVGAAKGKTKSRKRKRAPILLLLSGKYSSLSGEITLHLPRKRRCYILSVLLWSSSDSHKKDKR